MAIKAEPFVNPFRQKKTITVDGVTVEIVHKNGKTYQKLVRKNGDK